jgi:hypothetical protein
MHNNNEVYKNLLTLWSIQDELLQSYRTIFITSQSFLIPMVAFIALQSPLVAIVISTVGFFIVTKWHSICKARGYDVWFAHWRLLQFDHNYAVREDIMKDFKDWQNLNLKDRRFILENDRIGKLLVGSKTRSFLDFTLPLMFGLLWLFLIVYIIITNCILPN